jgi:glycosyltransferase involved in cell wall biosynthesis
MGLENLLKSIFLLKTQQVPVHLILAGEGRERQRIENILMELELDAEVSMRGFIPPHLLPKYYQAADFFVLPTRRLEGFGLVTVEALACGTPVLGTPVGGTKEILADLGTEFLFQNPSAEAMAAGIRKIVMEYHQDIDKYAALRDRCRYHASERFSLDRHIERLKCVVEGMLKGRLRSSLCFTP